MKIISVILKDGSPFRIEACRFYQTTSRLYQESPEQGILFYNEPVKKLFYREAIGAAGLLLILAADIFTKLHFVVLFSMAAWIFVELWIIYDYRKNRQQVSIEIVDTEKSWIWPWHS